jgi:hypothetical protein
LLRGCDCSVDGSLQATLFKLNLCLLTASTFQGGGRDFPRAICCADGGQRE